MPPLAIALFSLAGLWSVLAYAECIWNPRRNENDPDGLFILGFIGLAIYLAW